jgi:hypothetical protein
VVRQAEEAEAKAAVSEAERGLKAANLATSAIGLSAAEKKRNDARNVVLAAQSEKAVNVENSTLTSYRVATEESKKLKLQCLAWRAKALTGFQAGLTAALKAKGKSAALRQRIAAANTERPLPLLL